MDALMQCRYVLLHPLMFVIASNPYRGPMAPENASHNLGRSEHGSLANTIQCSPKMICVGV
jgi:hypothetical protein